VNSTQLSAATVIFWVSRTQPKTLYTSLTSTSVLVMLVVNLSINDKSVDCIFTFSPVSVHEKNKNHMNWKTNSSAV